MRVSSVAALCAAGLLAVPFAAKAAEYLLVDAHTGEPVAVVAMPTMPVAMPDIFAEQNAILQHVFGEMQANFDAPAPGVGLTPAMLGGMQPGSTVVTTSFSDGNNSCSRTVVYEQQRNAAPIAHVSQTGDACSALPAVRGATQVPAALPDAAAPAERRLPAVNPNSPKLLRVDYRHRVTLPQPKRG